MVRRAACTPLWRCSAWWNGDHQADCRGDWLRERITVQRRFCVIFGWRLW